jgi:hypothetical protein
MPVRMECAPAFNYAQAPHETSLIHDSSSSCSPTKALFVSPAGPATYKKAAPWAGLSMDLRVVSEIQPDFVEASAAPECEANKVDLQLMDLSHRGHLGPGVCAELELKEGQTVTFILRIIRDSAQAGDALPEHHEPPTKESAKHFGVSMERLAVAKNKLREEDDPILTIDLMRELLTVGRLPSFIA